MQNFVNWIAALQYSLGMDFTFSRIRDLPTEEQAPFKKWLSGQTCPWIDGLPPEEQDGYYEHDYQRWKNGFCVID